MAQQKIPDVLDKWIEDLKSKPIEQYSKIELQDKIDECAVFYDIIVSKDTKQLLAKFYNKMTTYYNTKSGKKIYNESLK